MDKVMTLREWHKATESKPQPKQSTTKKQLSVNAKELIKHRLLKGDRIKVIAYDFNVSVVTIWRVRNDMEL